MKRLTEYFECGAYVDKSNIVDISQVAGQFFEKGAYMGKAIDRLGEFEDFMESLGCEELEELEHLIGYQLFIDGYDKDGKEVHKIEFKTYKESFNEVFEKSKKLKQENQALNDRWNKLKEWVESLYSKTEIISEDLYLIKYKMQEFEKGVNDENI